MAELKTVTLFNVGELGDYKVTSYLFEEEARIKKIVLNAIISPTTLAVDGHLWLSKYADVEAPANIPAHGERGHLALIHMRSQLVTSGMAVLEETIVIDMGNDYVEVKEDNKLYLHSESIAGCTMKGYAVVYYEE